MNRVHNFGLILCLSIFVVVWSALPAEARGFRVSLIPNGSQNNCVNCHLNAGGGGTRNAFGQDVRSLVSPGGQEKFWGPELAAEDSDQDGFTNGQELGDSDGDGIPNRKVNISLPGDADSSPTMTLGDCNLDTVLDAHDLPCVGDVGARDVVLAMLNALPGDLNGDGEVAFSDFLVLSANFGSDLPAYTDGNIDLTGSVDFADFLVLSANFGLSPATLASVPEPDGSKVVAGGLLAIVLRRRMRTSPLKQRES